MKKLLEGKNAVITGSKGGIGHCMVETFAENGANVYACARAYDAEFESQLAVVADKYNVEIWPVYFDLSDSEQIKLGVKEITEKKHPIHVLVNNAGITHRALFAMTSIATARNVFEVDYFAPFQFTQLILKSVTRSKNACSIINVSSTSALDGNGGRSVYGAAKNALATFSRVLAEEYGTQGIRVNSIAPGITDTGMITLSSEQIDQIVSETALRKKGKPQDVANAALFLASDMSSYITGQTIRVDGGIL